MLMLTPGGNNYGKDILIGKDDKGVSVGGKREKVTTASVE